MAAKVVVLTLLGLLPHHHLPRVERAIVAQSRQLARYYHTPAVRFGPNGWPVYFARWSKITTICGNGDLGCHGPFQGVPQLWIGVGSGWTVTLSHEVLETLTDPLTVTRGPDGQLEEVGDPVNDCVYRTHGVWLSDFVLPAYWWRHRKRRDFMHHRYCFFI